MKRKDLIESLINFTAPIQSTLDKLSQYSWDSNEYEVLKSFHIRTALMKYLSLQLSEQEIEDWANAIESREDIEFSSERTDLIENIIYELANPLLTSKFNRERAIELLKILS
ncbi:MAG: hypothetical protein P0S96_01170 [Simkaniaceae bacterium]|nr:hypothetical protein [Candidatus Sacchlamyda saccharinae]